MKKAVVLLSGGLDSTTCLAIANDQGYDCYALSFDYGQKHRAELAAAKKIANNFGAIKHEIITLSIGALGGSALTDNAIDVPDYKQSNTVPVTYVPARNTVFLSIALGWAEILDAEAIFIGVTAIDYSGYPDCRPEFIAAFQNLANVATKAGLDGKPIHIETPLIKLSKSDIIKLGNSLDVDYSLTVSCYRANQAGEACGNCDSCALRKKGFSDAGLDDITKYA
ncbi:MAG: 7-cyano-7-deazaguanine synthase QueC [Gammaproteobacteria bacterium]|nr:7-cyano-7-deazaguanine synthase QueC [Gammaproteobacteria bacterium]